MKERSGNFKAGFGKRILTVLSGILLFAALLFQFGGLQTEAAASPGRVTQVFAKAASSHSVKLKWKGVKGAKGFQIYLVTEKGRRKIATVKAAKKPSYTVKKLKKDATYRFQVRAFGKNAFGPFSKTVSVRVTTNPADYKYGVFLSVTKNLNQLKDYQIVVIDAEYFTKKEIEAFKRKGHKVYSYINVGSIETFRNYFRSFPNLLLGSYENWEEEYWVDVSDARWQTFMRKKKIPSLLGKGIDGFFVDNCDVYFHYPKKRILKGLAKIMKTMTGTGKAVLINGGDAFLDAYCAAGGSWKDVCTGINQETVFSKILWDGDRFGRAGAEDQTYFQNYVRRYAAKGASVYLLEYTTDPKLIKQIRSYCKKNRFHYYVSDSIELDC